MMMAWWNLIAFLITNQAILLLGDTCYNLTSPGSISPKNDIYLSVGNPLRLNCTLEHVNGTYTPQNIVWTRINSNKSLDSSVVNTTVISANTSQLSIENTTISDTAGYSCKLKINTNTSDTMINICSAYVKIGYPPPINATINCELKNWNGLTCTWKQPENPIDIKWLFKYNRNNMWISCKVEQERHLENIVKCNGVFRATSCIYITLTGTNQLQSDVVTKWAFRVDKHVILAKPTVEVTQITERDAKIEWIVNSKKILNLTCEISYNCNWKIQECEQQKVYVTIFATQKSICNMKCEKDTSDGCKETKDADSKFNDTGSYKLHGLLPFTNYSVNVRCQIESTALTKKWSEMASTNFRTKHVVSNMKLATVVEEIQNVSTNGSCTLRVYWKGIPQHLRNGEKFWYNITNGIVSWTTNVSVMVLDNLNFSYHQDLNITPCNEMGCANSTRIVIPKPDLASELLQVFAVQYYPHNKYELTWRTSMLNVKDNFVILKCTVRNSDTSPQALKGQHCDTTSEVLQANVTEGYKVNVTHHHSNSMTIHTYAMYSMNLTFNLPDSGFKYKFAVAIRNATFSSGLASVSCTVENAHQSVKFDSVKEGKNWAEIKWEIPNGCLRKKVKGYNISYWTSDNKVAVVLLDDPFATTLNLTGLSPNKNYEGKLAFYGLPSDFQMVLPFTFQTKDDHGNSEAIMGIVVGSMAAGIIFIAMLTAVTVYLVKKIKTKVKELKNIQIPSGLRDDSNLFHRPPLLSHDSTDLPMTKLDSPLLMHVPSSPPAPERLPNGSNSSGFGSDFQGSTTSSPTTSFSSANHMSHDCNTDLDTPSVIAVDSVFEYPFDPVTSYSLVGKSDLNDIQLLNPSSLVCRESNADESTNGPLSYAKVAILPIQSYENTDSIANSSAQIHDDQLDQPQHDPYSFSKGYTTLAAADLMMQPYMKVALDSDATHLSLSKEDQVDAVNPLAYVSVGMSNSNRNLSDEQLSSVAAGGAGLGYVSCSYITDSADNLSATVDSDQAETDDESTSDDSLILIEDMNMLKRMDEANG